MPETNCGGKPAGDPFQTIVGSSPRTRHILRLIDKVSRGRWPVLILGETGTGKELVARGIHDANPVGPFVTIDCSSVVGPLIESELFGYARGAFTGAHTSKIGLIELANGGTAFFDEIGELPLELQAKLLRLLQEKEFRPVGALAQRKSDFRIIAATNRDLAKEVERGTFRRDLYYRLNVVNLRLAPLRERKEDIPALVTHFLAKYGAQHQVAGEVLEALATYQWPGNVRELENCIQQMVAMNSGPVLQRHDLPTALRNFLAQQQPILALMEAVAPSRASAGHNAHSVLPLHELERRAILEALEYTKGDRVMAAHLLGIGRTTLYRKLKEYQVGGDDDAPELEAFESARSKHDHA